MEKGWSQIMNFMGWQDQRMLEILCSISCNPTNHPKNIFKEQCKIVGC